MAKTAYLSKHLDLGSFSHLLLCLLPAGELVAPRGSWEGALFKEEGRLQPLAKRLQKLPSSASALHPLNNNNNHTSPLHVLFPQSSRKQSTTVRHSHHGPQTLDCPLIPTLNIGCESLTTRAKSLPDQLTAFTSQRVNQTSPSLLRH